MVHIYRTDLEIDRQTDKKSLLFLEDRMRGQQDVEERMLRRWSRICGGGGGRMGRRPTDQPTLTHLTAPKQEVESYNEGTYIKRKTGIRNLVPTGWDDVYDILLQNVSHSQM